MARTTTLAVAAAAFAAALTLTLTSSASTPVVRTDVQTYQGKTAMQWHHVAVQRRLARDYLQQRLGVRVRQVRALERAKLPSPKDVSYAIHLAATVYGVNERAMHSVASCESGHSAFARNGQYRGVFQEGPMFEGGKFGRAGFTVWDPIANALTAAETVSREGWAQWQCRP